MKNIVKIVLGVTFLLVAVICPLPALLAVPGGVWRIMIGLLGFLCLASGIYHRKRK